MRRYLMLFIGMSIFFSCKEKQEITIPGKDGNEPIKEKLLVGSWEDQSPSTLHFTLFSDGTARSDSMATLVYKEWEVKGRQLILISESIGNRNSSIDTTVYEIIKLDKASMVLKDREVLYKYRKLR